MKCLICESNCYFFLKKKFDAPYDEYLGVVEYYKCSYCGFVFSKTHALLDQYSWEKINYLFHSFIENSKNHKATNQPPYLAQATLLNVLAKNELISVENSIDWGGGRGTLSKALQKYFGIKIPVYEKYMQSKNTIEQEKNTVPEYIKKEDLINYETVLSSAVFEHVTKREYLDEINKCVAPDGCLVLHTVICENIPKDNNWFYLLPVHCAFHTNRSMELLMQQWGYTSSIYCPPAKSWILQKQENKKISENSINQINLEFQFEYLHQKIGFMDYWK